jgi:dihydrofolate synthase/folylpolyglutamate synthase
MLRTLAPHFQRFLLTRYTLNQRAVPPEELAEQLTKFTAASIEIHPQPADAWQSARANAGPNDLIVVTGSVFLAGELRPLLV